MPPAEDRELSPEESENYDELASLWQDEDIAAFRDVVEANEDERILGGYLMVELDPKTAEALVDKARGRGIAPGKLASEIIQDALTDEKK